MTAASTSPAGGLVTRPIPPFEPHPWFRGGHAQTVAGAYLPSRRTRLPFTAQEIVLDDGDRLSVLDSTPPGWRPGRPTVLVVHGLGGSAVSRYVSRAAAKLVGLGLRVVRMNLRGAGSGFGLARRTYHSGLTGDVRAVADWMTGSAPDSPLALLGFSLGGNLVLKLAAEATAGPLAGLDAVIAANPPIDLAAACRHIRRPENRAYDRNFVRLLVGMVDRLHARFPDLGPTGLAGVRSLHDFDDAYTAPRHGFRDAEDYYARSSAGPLLPEIAVAGLVIHAEDDPFMPPDIFRRAEFPPTVRLELVRHGGHLGYLSRRPWWGDRRWLDARIAAWLADRWELDGGPPCRADGPSDLRAEDRGVRIADCKSDIPAPDREHDVIPRL